MTDRSSPRAIRPEDACETSECPCGDPTLCGTVEPIQSRVEVGNRFLGWGRTWEVSRVWAVEGVAKIVCTDDPARTMQLPLTQFKEMPRG